MNTEDLAACAGLVHEVAKLYGAQHDKIARLRALPSLAQRRLLETLAAHDRAETPLTQRELARCTGLTPMAVSGHCDRLFALGWIIRSNAANDRRVWQIHLVEQARDVLRNMGEIDSCLTERAFQNLDAAERVGLSQSLRKMLGSLNT
jgi:DNA-binding MarR family transcriptional regulator